MKIKVMKVDEKSSIKHPVYSTSGAAGFDLVNGTDRAWVIPPGGRTTIGCGLMFEIPEGYELQIRPRSGLAFNFGVLTSFGTIDSDYRGEVKLNMMNFSRIEYCVAQGARIAQAVLAPVVRAEFEIVNELTKTERGTKGLGSTGL